MFGVAGGEFVAVAMAGVIEGGDARRSMGARRQGCCCCRRGVVLTAATPAAAGEDYGSALVVVAHIATCVERVFDYIRVVVLFFVAWCRLDVTVLRVQFLLLLLLSSTAMG